METQIYIVLYTHRYGSSISLVESDHFPTQEELIEKRIIEDFEPGREDEFIEVELAPPIERI